MKMPDFYENQVFIHLVSVDTHFWKTYNSYNLIFKISFIHRLICTFIFILSGSHIQRDFDKQS